MRTLSGFCIALLGATGLFAQLRGGGMTNPAPARGGGSAVYPAGGSGPGVQRSVGSVVHPGGNFPQIGIPYVSNGNRGVNRPAYRGGGGAVYAYPVYVGGSYYSTPDSYYAPPAPQQPNVTVVYPPQPPTPVYIYPSQDSQYQSPPMYQAPPQRQQPAAEEPAAAENPHFLIAFKDHSIYSAVAYWVDGDTLHYFTNGNTHNQASISLVDRELTNRLNKDAGVEVKLPTPK